MSIKDEQNGLADAPFACRARRMLSLVQALFAIALPKARLGRTARSGRIRYILEQNLNPPETDFDEVAKTKRTFAANEILTSLYSFLHGT